MIFFTSNCEQDWTLSKKDSSWKKLLDTNSSIERYYLEWGGKYLKYGDHLWCPREDKYFESVKILYVRLKNKAIVRRLSGVIDEKLVL